MARRTIRSATEAICRTLQGPVSLRWLVRQVVESLGIDERPSTEVSVREALGRLRWMLPAGGGTYVPARVALDGRAMRLRPPDGGWGRMLPKWQLEPFATALDDPQVADEEGRPLARHLAPPDSERLRHEAEVRARRRAAQIVDFFLGMAARERRLGPGERRHLVDHLVELASEEQPGILEALVAAIAPYRLPEGWDDAADLIARYDAASHTLRLAPEPPDRQDNARIRQEDRRFCDFVASRLRRGSTVFLHDLLLQAYAQLPGFGEYPGSPPHLAVAGDPRLRIVRPISDLGGVELPTNLKLARADDFALLARLEQWQAESEQEQALGRRLRRLELHRTLPARIRQHLRALAAGLDETERDLGLIGGWRKAGAAGPTAGAAPASEPAPVSAAARPADDEALLVRWEQSLRQQGLSEEVRSRKVRHLQVLAQYLASGEDFAPTGLLGVTGAHLTAFFFSTYVRRFPCSPSDAESFTLDVRDFYRWAERQALLADSRFAEVPYRLRRHVADRIRLYAALDPDDPDWEPLLGMLFLSGPL